jgi:hypothetical protein
MGDLQLKRVWSIGVGTHVDQSEFAPRPKRALFHVFTLLIISLVMPSLSAIAQELPSDGRSAEGTSIDAKKTDLSARVLHVESLIPSVTPYLFSLTAPGAPDERDRLSRLWSELLQQARERQALLDDQFSPEEKAAWVQMLSQIERVADAETWEKIGFDQLPLIYLYGLGLAPALIVELPDPKRFKAWISQRAQERPNHGFEERRHPKGSYWRKVFTRWTLVAHLKGSLLHVALIPRSTEPTLISHFLNPPKETVSVERARLFDVLTADAPSAKGSGWINFQLLMKTIFGGAPDLLSASVRPLGLPLVGMAPCDQELLTLVTHLPQLIIGVERKNSNLTLLSVLKMSPKLSSFFQEISTDRARPLPLSKPLQLSISLDASKLMTALERVAHAQLASPWRCQLLDRLNGVSRLTQAPSWAQLKMLTYPLSGLSLYAHPPQTTEDAQEPTAAQTWRGWFSLRYDNPQVILGMIRGHPSVPPWISSLSLDLSGVPTPVEHAPQSWMTPLFSLSPSGALLSVGGDIAARHEAFHRPSAQDQKTQPHQLDPLFSLQLSKEVIDQWRDRLRSTVLRLKARPAPSTDGESAPSNSDPPSQKEVNPSPSLKASKRGYLIDKIEIRSVSQGLLILKYLDEYR